MTTVPVPPVGSAVRLCDAGLIGSQQRSIVAALLATEGRVISRRDLARRAGLLDVNERRCDALLVQIRRVLGADSIRTVRGRGWMLQPTSVASARAALTTLDAAHLDVADL